MAHNEKPPRNNSGWRADAADIRDELYRRNRRPLLERLCLRRRRSPKLLDNGQPAEAGKVVKLEDFRGKR